MQTTPEIQEQIDHILMQGGSSTQFSGIQKQKFLSNYSLGAMAFGCFYFFRVKDPFFGWLSLIFSLSFFLAPCLLILPFFARQRAWDRYPEQDFQSFYRVQKTWDRNAGYGLVALVIILLLTYHTVIGLLPKGNALPDTQQLQDSVQLLQQQ